MPNHYDPNQPRNAEGEWTDAGGAIKKAASDKKIKPIEEYIGMNPKVNKLAENWNEEAFLMEPGEWEEKSISNIIHETPVRKIYMGSIGIVEVKSQYAIAPDTKFKGRVLLLAREVDKSNKVLINWKSVGEYDGGNLGILQAHRGKGVGKAFVKELIKKDILKPSIGYSPKGLRAVKNAYNELKKN